VAEVCWRCGAVMEWRHGTWQCPTCQFKLGCCEGETEELRSCDDDWRADLDLVEEPVGFRDQHPDAAV
jgi:hypothetical protein